LWVRRGYKLDPAVILKMRDGYFEVEQTDEERAEDLIATVEFEALKADIAEALAGGQLAFLGKMWSHILSEGRRREV